MDDTTIIGLLWERNETGLQKLSAKYSGMYRAIFLRTTGSAEDAEECANDLLLALWNAIPPERPKSLTAFICRIARQIGVDKLRYNSRKKRSSGYTVMLSELEDCVPEEGTDSDADLDSQHIQQVISRFLRKLDPQTRVLFVRRYMYVEPVNSLAERFGLQENTVSARLNRARKQLKKALEKEGIVL